MGNIYVVVEHQKGKISDITFEMLGIGSEVANKTGKDLIAILLGNDIKTLGDSLGIANKILYINHPALTEVTPEAYSDVLIHIFKEIVPDFIFVSSNNISDGVGAMTAHKLNFPFINYCKEITVENNELITTSLLYGGKVENQVKPKDNKAVIAISSGSFPIENGKSNTKPSIEEINPPDLTQLKIKFIKHVEPEAGDIDISQQEILLAIGRGIQNQDNIALADELATAMGAATCASRPVVDQGWLPLTRQVGKSGMTVKPKLYLCAGISGAPEHIEGMKNSKLIISINTDGKAPIFNYSDYGVVTDLLELFPKLTEEVKKRKGG
ncbi:MAG: electron transfer flavoprotein subunit alpha/FixB family protein [Candidatus Thorarchaeota archaeon]